MKSIALKQQEAAAYAASGETFQLRRVVKVPATAKKNSGYEVEIERGGDFETALAVHMPDSSQKIIKAPYGAPGERVALREGFWVEHDFTDAEYGYGEDLGPCLDYERTVQYCASPEHLDPPKDGQQVIPHDKCEPGNWWLSPPDDWDGERDYSGSGIWVFLPWGAHSKLSSARMPLWAVRWRPLIKGVELEPNAGGVWEWVYDVEGRVL